MTPIATFGTRLRAAMDALGPLCVGVDPHPGLLSAWDLPDDADGLARFAGICTEAFAPSISKSNSLLGSNGITVNTYSMKKLVA